MLVCLFIDLFVLCFNHIWAPTESSPEKFAKMGLDLAEILRIRELDRQMFFVCWFVLDVFVFCFYHRRIPTGNFPQNFVKIRLDLAEILRISKLD